MKGQVIKRVYLEANSPRKAFYALALVRITDGYLVCKESGAMGKVLHKEAWFRESLEEAERLFEKKVLQKTVGNRRSSRRYVIVARKKSKIKQLSLL